MGFRVQCVLAVLFVLAGCAATGPNGTPVPSVVTNPASYLEDFPLNSVTKDDLIEDVGMPDKSMESGGQTYLSYEIGEGWGEREYIYVIEDGVVTNIRYNDQGPYNGSSAKRLQRGEE